MSYLANNYNRRKISFKKKKLVTSKEKIKDNNLIKIKSDWQKKALVSKKQYDKKYTSHQRTIVIVPL